MNRSHHFRKNTISLLSLVLLAELLVYWFSQQLTSDYQLSFQLAARYSARLSFLLFGIVYGWIAWYGLINIYKQELYRKYLLLLIFAFTLNHLIHLGFLSTNYIIEPTILSPIRHGGGAIAYVVLTILPIWLTRINNLSPRRYFLIHGSLFFIWIFFNQSYMGRIFQELELGSPKWIYALFFAITVALLIANIYRMVRERGI